jgi:uncharacterized SAM-binding protein YcdF (DUF218 family)
MEVSSVKDNLLLTHEQIDDINNIIRFLAIRDVAELSPEKLKKIAKVQAADLLILLGSSLIYTAELAAEVMKNGVAEKLMIVGGIGHSTSYLVQNINNHPVYKDIKTEDRAEADIFKDILVNYLGVDDKKIIIENKSTNCGSNAKEALKVIKELSLSIKSVILIQDPTMQLRSYASFRQEWKEEKGVTFINYSPFIPILESAEGGACYKERTISGLWDMDRLLSLILGEIPRLQDDENGYGPKGKGFIAHIDIPQEVISSNKRLLSSLHTWVKNRCV